MEASLGTEVYIPEYDTNRSVKKKNWFVKLLLCISVFSAGRLNEVLISTNHLTKQVERFDVFPQDQFLQRFGCSSFMVRDLC